MHRGKKVSTRLSIIMVWLLLSNRRGSVLTSLYLPVRNSIEPCPKAHGSAQSHSWCLLTTCLYWLSSRYVDDTTLSKVLQPKRLNSSMKTYIYIQNLIDWATLNDMQLNTSKTKEILGPLARANYYNN